MKLNKLTNSEKRVIIDRDTEPPFSGKYENFFEKGTYACMQCGAPLYNSESKFHSGCGWPSFDDEIKGAVKRIPDPDGIRTEIICTRCGGHLGHIFEGEGFTPKNTRHCVNSISMDFIPSYEVAVLGGGCFWCMEAVFLQVSGVLKVESGYAGGWKEKPTYNEVCSGDTGHAEVVRIEFDPKIINYKQLLDIFFYIHDPTTLNKQGNDTGEQYRSIILYTSADQEKISKEFISKINSSGIFKNPVLTELKSLEKFYKAEDYHQNYFTSNTRQPYCSAIIAPKAESFRKRFSKLLKN